MDELQSDLEVHDVLRDVEDAREREHYDEDECEVVSSTDSPCARDTSEAP